MSSKSLKRSIQACLLLTVVPLAARAEDVKKECIDSSTLGQTSRDGGELLKAREQFLQCSREACPPVVRTSCNRWLTEVDELIPSVVIRASDATGSDITDGTASIDGVSHPLDGKTIQLDPGKHVVAVESRDGTRAEKKVLLAAGEKSRLIELHLGPSGAPASEAPTGPSKPVVGASPPTAPEAPSTDRKASIPTGAWVLGGASVVALGSFAFFGLSAKSELDKLKVCSPYCTDKQTQTGRNDALVADISLGVGVAALAGAVVWALVAKPEPKEATAAARLSIAPTPSGGFATLSTAF
ncbi:MAG TPA: hypothetical protein VHB79_29300 [Polyangiaceae bacterium]|nr:hypothetical protein [Polyangiaceae bacterium]